MVFLLYLDSGDIREWEKPAHPSKWKKKCNYETKLWAGCWLFNAVALSLSQVAELSISILWLKQKVGSSLSTGQMDVSAQSSGELNVPIVFFVCWILTINVSWRAWCWIALSLSQVAELSISIPTLPEARGRFESESWTFQLCRSLSWILTINVSLRAGC